MLDATVTAQLKEHLGKIREPVELAASLDGGPASDRTARLLDEIAALSDLVRVVRTDDDPRRPSFAVRRAGAPSDPGAGIRFAGAPLGHELSSLVLAVLWVGGHPSTASADVIERIRAVDRHLRFETYLSLSCQNCPEVVQALNLMSAINPRIGHVAIDGAVFRDEVEERSVMAVPAVFLDGEPFVTGRTSIEEILDRLDPRAGEREVAALDAREPYDVLIVGGGPAGAAAAVYAARKELRTGVVAERFGGQVLDTMSIENFVSVPHTEGPAFGAALEEHVRGHDVDVITRQRAARLVPAEGPGALHTVELSNGASLRARTVVLSTGARWREMGVPGESEHRNRGVTFCPHCDGPLFRGKRVAVIGGGNSGVEAAIDLAGVTAHVTLLEFDDRLRADEVLQRALRALPDVDVVTSARTTEVIGDGARVTGLAYEDRTSGESHKVELDGVFVQIGLLPNTDWLDGVVERSGRGEVVVDERGRTSVPGVFAAGDCTTAPYKQIVVALGAGATAALSAFDHLIRSEAQGAEPTPAGSAAAPDGRA
ncbi:MAG: alkyl hydroperoxide reductase subunit F [Acidimicrobiia bacterium]|nr:alkyl hydroperoxide reductase subunit F [Acidimicrobiia bacterium]